MKNIAIYDDSDADDDDAGDDVGCDIFGI